MSGAVLKRRHIAVIAVCAGQLMITLDSTVGFVALPAIQTDLRLSPTTLAWVVNGYLVPFGGLLMLAGGLGDSFGKVRVFFSGLTLFVLGSVGCGFSRDATALITSRVVQGAGAALLSSMVLGLLGVMFDVAHERARAMSVYGFVSVGGGSVGLLVGGVLTQTLGWHWIFFVNVPVGGAVALAAAPLLTMPDTRRRTAISLVGGLLVTITATALVAGMLWQSATALVGAALFACALVLHERRARRPLVPETVRRSRSVAAATIVRLCWAVGSSGALFVGTLYLEHVGDYSPLEAGAAFLPNMLLTAVVTVTVAPMLLRATGARALMTTGLAFVAAGLILLARTPEHVVYARDVLPTMLLLGGGAGLAYLPTITVAMAHAGPADAGVASAITNVAVQIGAAIGVALATIFAAPLTSGVADLAHGYRYGLLAAAVAVSVAFGSALTLVREPDRSTGELIPDDDLV